jgi:hypothetical protein
MGFPARIKVNATADVILVWKSFKPLFNGETEVKEI